MNRRRESGAALLMALLFVALVVVFGLAMHANGRNLVISNQAIRQDATCRWAAEGGIEAARAALAKDASYAGGTIDVGGTAVRVQVSPIEGDSGMRLVIAEARTAPSGPTARAGRARIDATLRLGAGLPTIDRWTER